MAWLAKQETPSWGAKRQEAPQWEGHVVPTSVPAGGAEMFEKLNAIVTRDGGVVVDTVQLSPGAGDLAARAKAAWYAKNDKWGNGDWIGQGSYQGPGGWGRRHKPGH